MLESNQRKRAISTLVSLKEDQSKTLGLFLTFHEISPAEFLGHLQLTAQEAPDDRVLTQYKDLLLHLDNYSDGWLDTPRCSEQRRNIVYETLGIEKQLREFSESECPFPSDIEQPVIIAEKAHHPDWYKTSDQNFYFSNYLEFLKTKKGFGTNSLLGMEYSTKRVMELLADPQNAECYQSKGLVVGYVQSGKTANFIGVCARAADAGYKLIIVLAGTTKILRHQSQRRIDKDLIGKDFCVSDAAYGSDLPADWEDFIEHKIEKALSHPKWERLTTIGNDGEYAPLRTNISRLQFKQADKQFPLNHPINLHSLPITIAVIKKNPPMIIDRLIKDLEISETNLNELPCLIIDDESDQASLNTASLPVEAGDERDRTETNRKIIELLNKLPRAQYVGYTATPYANALVNPEDEEDLFPKDFIISLEKPSGYMGVEDFFDESDILEEELENNPYLSREKSFIRAVKGSDDHEKNLRKAFCSFVISGAIKLYRQTHDKRFLFPHHTMLVHTSPSKEKHDDIKQVIDETFGACAFSTPSGMSLLEEEWNEYCAISKIHGLDYLTPSCFNDLAMHIPKCLNNIHSTDGISLLLNSSTDSNEAPKWEEKDIWKIIIGGNKLSRGYTIEGLTVSYYRRTARMADTIMQMGRWFGHRGGYSDLVRLYIGTEEKAGKKTINLLDAYKDLCTMEEHLRAELKQYKKKDDGRLITPRDIPPLIHVVSNIEPTAKNKRLEADIVDLNFSAKRTERTLAPHDQIKISSNQKAAEKLLISAELCGQQALGGSFSNKSKSTPLASVWTATAEKVNEFLSEYKWSKVITEFNLERKFIQDNSALYSRFIILMFQKDEESFGAEWLGKYKVSKRGRKDTDNNPFKAFSDKRHRAIAQYITHLSDENKERLRLEEANEATKKLIVSERNQGVLLLYPVREKETDEISIGFTIQHPENSLEYHLKYGAIRREPLADTDSD